MSGTVSRDDAGAVAVWTLALVVLAYLATGVIVDVGAAITAKTRTLDVAQQAARAGADQLDLAALRARGEYRLDPAAARAAALDFLQAADRGGTVTVAQDVVTVTATYTQPTVMLRAAGVRAIPVTATAHAAPSTT